MSKIEKRNLNEIAIMEALKVLSGKWKLKVLWEIYTNDIIRFNMLQRNIEGISSVMLTRVLNEFIDKNLIIRKQFNEVPPHVEYSLSEFGKTLCPVLRLLEEFGNKLL